MKLVYTAGPVRNSSLWQRHQNIIEAEKISVELWKMGFAVICPHKNTEFIDGEITDESIISGDLEIIKRCDAVILLPGWSESEGTRIEFNHALDHQIPIFNWTVDSDKESLRKFVTDPTIGDARVLAQQLSSERL